MFNYPASCFALAVSLLTKDTQNDIDGLLPDKKFYRSGLGGRLYKRLKFKRSELDRGEGIDDCKIAPYKRFQGVFQKRPLFQTH
jgi:hypothetical protein